MNYLPLLPKQQTFSKAAYDGMRDQIVRVARYQRFVLMALLVNVTSSALVVAQRLELIPIPTNFVTLVSLVHFPACIFMTVCAVLLAKQFWHIALAILCGLLMWVPLVSLVVLIAVNQKATRFLQRWGVYVGLLGANPRRL